MELPPALTLFGVVAFGVVFGPLGLVLAVPALVVAYVAVKKLWVRDTLGEPTPVPGEDDAGPERSGAGWARDTAPCFRRRSVCASLGGKGMP